jgi:hypothetical protein
MQKYAIIVLKRQGMDIEPIKEMFCAEERAIREAMRIFKTAGMQKVGVLDEHMSLIFKDTRICKCSNIQTELFVTPKNDIEYKDVCVNCKVVINHDAWELGLVEEHKAVIS